MFLRRASAAAHRTAWMADDEPSTPATTGFEPGLLINPPGMHAVPTRANTAERLPAARVRQSSRSLECRPWDVSLGIGGAWNHSYYVRDSRRRTAHR
ncbi:hypothetical protein GCM10009533_36640 [Saccharopolyspora spinosporotrichia]|uniref:Uncharacterized protein n=1 Tax=Saccharopolyspora erythraea TaxID=1836 RepID=A0ABP3N2L1_SACER